jgi:hypothetical protein
MTEKAGIKPEFRNRNGSAPASVAVFRALAENPGAQKCSKRSWRRHAQPAGREGAASNARGGRAPPASEFGLKRPKTSRCARATHRCMSTPTLCASATARCAVWQERARCLRGRAGLLVNRILLGGGCNRVHLDTVLKLGIPLFH